MASICDQSSAHSKDSSLAQIEINSEPPRFFLALSGEILWGQYHCLFEGSKSTSHDGPSKLGAIQQSGTIIQRNWQYRLAARKGKWLVSRLKIDENGVGFIVYHEDIDPTEYTKLASDTGISNDNQNGNKKILYVNRYDWGANHKDSRDFLEAAASISCSGKVEEDELSNYRLKAACCVLLDATYFGSLLQLYAKLPLKTGFPPKTSFSLVNLVNSNTPIGVHLTDEAIEYDLAWIGFSGDKHPDFPESDECVAFVYDTAYTGLELTKGQKLYVGDRLAKICEDN